jgi:hypothetical protein
MGELARFMAEICAPLTSVVLYLCSTAAEISDPTGRREKPARPQPVRTKQGERLFAPSQPTTWEVAYRLGAALRAGQAQQAQEAAAGPWDPERQRVRPQSHIRRAHWHTYWTGKGRTIPRVRWLHPLLIGSQEGMVPTLHKVE